MIKSINSLEISSICNNKCLYCPVPVQHKHRPTGHMSFDTFKICIDVIGDLPEQMELNLFGCGEPTLNPDLCKMIRYARAQLPARQIIHLNTNGKTMTLDYAKELKDTGINHIDITAHILNDATMAKHYFEQVGLSHNISIDPLTNPNNWAGLVDWPDCGKRYTCPWLNNQQAYIYFDGDIATCCLNAFKFADGVHGNIKDGLEGIELKPYGLCKKCHQNITPEVTNKAWFEDAVL